MALVWGCGEPVGGDDDEWDMAAAEAEAALRARSSLMEDST